jgi:hypothetical protein
MPGDRDLLAPFDEVEQMAEPVLRVESPELRHRSLRLA